MSGQETLTNRAGVVVFDGTATPRGGSQPAGLAIYGDGSDGDITVDSDMFNWPDPTPFPAWDTATLYALGDQVKTTDANPRVYTCVKAGTSDNSAPPWYDTGVPGLNRRGARIDEGYGKPAWEQETAICKGWLEGPIFAANFDDGGHTLHASGWPIYASVSATISGHLSGDGLALDSDQATGDDSFGFSWPAIVTLLGRGVLGKSNGNGNVGTTWGGGIGGDGGSGADGPGSNTGFSTGPDAPAFTLTRRMLTTLFSPLWLAPSTGSIGSSGGAGTGDTSGGKAAGASGSAGSGLAVFARALHLTGTITALGGDGQAGEAGGDTGGGGAGSGGCCVLIYDSKTGAGTVTVDGGSGGAGQGTGTDGGGGSPGDIVEIANAA